MAIMEVSFSLSRRSVQLILCTLLAIGSVLSPLERAEAQTELSDSATTGVNCQYWNFGSKTAWRNPGGDWIDSNGIAQGTAAFEGFRVADTDTTYRIAMDLTPLVKTWAESEVYRGILIRNVGNSNSAMFSSREGAISPTLQIAYADGTSTTLRPTADSHLVCPGTTMSGGSTQLRLDSTRNIVMRFDAARRTDVTAATLYLTTTAQNGVTYPQVYRLNPPGATYSCVRSNPVVQLTPASTIAPAGASVTYMLKVTNRDSASCTATPYQLQSLVPAGFNAVLGQASLTVAAGASGSTTVKVTSPSNAPFASYNVSITAANQYNPSLKASTSSVYAVSTAATATPIPATPLPTNPIPATPVPSTPAPTPAGSDFATRCAAPGVIRCESFDAQPPSRTKYPQAFGVDAGTATTPTLDTAVKASGAGSLRFTVPSNSDASAAGEAFINFSNDFQTQIGENSEFYVQWRQRFSPEFAKGGLGGDGWKQIIIGEGSTATKTAYSCTLSEVVVTNGAYWGFPRMYNACTPGTTSHGGYDNFFEPFHSTANYNDFKYQNARPAPYCLYSQSRTSPTTFFPPTGNCFGYLADEWMTFQVHIKTGPRVNDEFANSYVELWIARAGKPSEKVIAWGPYNLSVGSNGQRYGQVWLTPYDTNKSTAKAHPTAYTWYDELIISRSRIADPK